ncbi:transcription antitermination factor NusB [Caldibacillus lycopersici]|uniref:Transcription antitermination protein NusB n=1 Tax=Perspicuibacillus lycopersici TaxID=1325689 RepID=A0AAE3ITE1_9BACI|nr:transcription antitermination factor NusB [Perspicuibacillus lycopersici]MCU9613832.1 transcription antitermination factor NusB [Perspicuibacillus lycopersici]
MNRRTAREKALQAIFQVDVGKVDAEQAYEHVLEDEEKDPFLEKVIYGTINHLEEIDQLISEHLENWTISRLANVDRNILRISVYEMKYMEEIPTSVAINEALEIAKKFGDENSSRFINGVLSKVKKALDK